MSDDFALLSAWRDGNRHAGNALFQRHFDRVRRFLRTKVDGDIDDLLQTVFLACVQGKVRMRESTFRAYLLGVCRNVVFTHYRKKNRDAVDLTNASIHDLSPSASQVIDKAQDEHRLLAALQRLPLDQQIALELCFWEGLSRSETAAVLEIPEGTVASRLRRAQTLLTQALKDLGASATLLESTATGLTDWATRIADIARGDP